MLTWPISAQNDDRPSHDGPRFEIVEATIPAPTDSQSDSAGKATSAAEGADGSFVDRMLEVLRKTPVLRLGGNRTVTLKNVRPPAKTLSLSADSVA